MTRNEDLDYLYELLNKLEKINGDKRTLKDPAACNNLPRHGIYFFFSGEEKRELGKEMRITRIGTHAVNSQSKRTLRDRLRQHQGNITKRGRIDGGSHRGSAFRKLVGFVLIHRDNLKGIYPEWGSIKKKKTSPPNVRADEHELEKKVSYYIRELPFTWLEVDDSPGSNSERAYIETNSIALVSNYKKTPLDPRIDSWLGKHCPKEEVQESELWNIKDVKKEYDKSFLGLFEKYIKKMK